ncbi:MAG TPA: hypothetical protein VHB79_27620 [Polyangiaceae bacterium]|nr:hypothetical protein [Polyangiaceae bacterium]
MTSKALDKLELMFDSEVPTKINPAGAAAAARAAAKALADEALRKRELDERESGAQEIWCDSEAPTGVAAERPLLPRPPRAPRV